MNTYTLLLGGLISIFLSIWILYTQVNLHSTPGSYYLQPIIWFWSAILISSTFTFAYRVIEPFTKFNNQKLFTATVVVAAIIKYIAISIAFILAYLKKGEQLKKWETSP